MVIANPIYDVVFKKLMEDERIAKFFIGTLLEETIEEVQVKPQEFTYSERTEGLAVFRLDFIATIRTEAGDFKKVLIEIQKSRNPIDLMRFRNYLGEQYKKEDEIAVDNSRQKKPLPIVTIYLLGYALANIDTAAVRVTRQYVDLLTHKIIYKKNDFIEKLTHDSYVVQLPLIGSKYQSRLEKLLSIFEQNYFVDDKGIIKEYNYEIDDDTIKSMVDILHYAGTDPKQKKKIEDEQEAHRVLDLAVREKTEELKGIIQEKDKALDAKDKALDEMAKQLAELKQRLEGR